VVIFDCNGVLVDSEQIAAEMAVGELARAGIAITPEVMIRYLSGRRPADMFAMIESLSERKLPANFGATVAAATVKRLRADLRAIPHAGYALTWLRGPKCVASSSPPEPAWRRQLWRGSSNLSFPQTMCRMASLHPIYSCTQQRGWAYTRPTASWSKTLRLV
jgi:beta-phosphoglucomutase-like phosphatase (HAD superfamily)